MLNNSKPFAKASFRMIRVSPRKLNLVAQLVRGLTVREAMKQLEFSKKRIAEQVGKCVKSAAFNAENNQGINMDTLVVSSITVGKAACMKRLHPRARGRAAQVKKFFSNLYVTVVEAS